MNQACIRRGFAGAISVRKLALRTTASSHDA